MKGLLVGIALFLPGVRIVSEKRIYTPYLPSNYKDIVTLE